MTRANSYSYDIAYAAMCIWEEILEPANRDMGTPWQACRDAVGTATLRGLVLERLAAPCDAAWTKASRLYEEADRNWQTRRRDHEAADKPFYDDPPQDPGSFDWEFVPTWLWIAVDWSDPDNGPRVFGSVP